MKRKVLQIYAGSKKNYRTRINLQDERANSQGECPVDIQSRKPQADGMAYGYSALT